MHNLLGTTTSSTFIPGMNLKGAASGANWMLLLPGLELTRVLCIGTPAAATVDALAERCEQLFVLVEGDSAHSSLTAYRPNLTVCRELLNLPDGSMDLIVVVGGRGRPPFHKDYCLQHEALRLLKRDGLLYRELYWVWRRSPEVSKQVQPASALEQATVLWMTPVGGEAHSIVPLNDGRTIDYLVERGLCSPHPGLTGYRTRLAHVGVQGTGDHHNQRKLGKVASLLDRRAGKLLARAEGLASQARLHRMVVMRQGVLAGHAAGALAFQPPAYLCQLAAAEGVDLSSFRWGLSAPGDYASRKAIFYLFPRTAGAAGDAPHYVVKMVRRAAFSPRLRNEADALRRLAELGIGADGTLPQIAFAGEHAGLAIVGTGAIRGSSFRAAIAGDTTGVHLNKAVHWLTNLAAITGATNRASGTAVAQILEKLLSRFLELYQVDARHRSFLAGQIDCVARTPHSIPIVFQHGDPGVWNLMLTDAGDVAFLDWEAAEANGFPLWDLFYFLRSYVVSAARAGGAHTPLDAFAAALLRETPFSQVMRGAVANYCHQTGLAEELVQPLFFTCWMHRALKEATRLAPARLDSGHYINLLRMCIDTHAGGPVAWQTRLTTPAAATTAQFR